MRARARSKKNDQLPLEVDPLMEREQRAVEKPEGTDESAARGHGGVSDAPPPKLLKFE
jgi:hypothetical protein